MSNTITFTMTLEQAALIHQLASEQMAAQKNWIVSAVEEGHLERAQRIAREMRGVQNIFGSFNVEAKKFVAEATGKDFPTHIEVRR